MTLLGHLRTWASSEDMPNQIPNVFWLADTPRVPKVPNNFLSWFHNVLQSWSKNLKKNSTTPYGGKEKHFFTFFLVNFFLLNDLGECISKSSDVDTLAQTPLLSITS